MDHVFPAVPAAHALDCGAAVPSEELNRRSSSAQIRVHVQHVFDVAVCIEDRVRLCVLAFLPAHGFSQAHTPLSPVHLYQRVLNVLIL